MKNLLVAALMTFSAPILAQSGPEPILGLTTNLEGITFQVFSGGCSRKVDFQLVQKGASPVQVTLQRNHVDACEAFVPYGTTVKFTWQELGLPNGTMLTIVNPIAPIRVNRGH